MACLKLEPKASTFFILGGLLCLLSCSKEKLQERVVEQTGTFYPIWHPLDNIPTSEMSPATLAFHRKSLLTRRRLLLTYKSSTFCGPSLQMDFSYFPNQDQFNLLFKINNYPSIRLKSEDILFWGITPEGLETGAKNLVQVQLNDKEVGFFSERIPRRLNVTPSKSTSKPHSQFHPAIPLTFSWLPDPLYEQRQLLVSVYFSSFEKHIPTQHFLIPDNGFYDAQPILDTTSVSFLSFQFTRFVGDLINLQEGFFVEFQTYDKHEVYTKPKYIMNWPNAFPPNHDTLLPINAP